jgi:molecular chaperone DnaK
MEDRIIYGVDLGTTFSAAAYVNPQNAPVCIHLGEHGEWAIPSSVLFVDKKTAYVGEEAIVNSYRENSLLVEFAKRDLGLQNGRTWDFSGRLFRPEDISALVLRKVVKQTGRDRSLPLMRDVVISHPQYFYLNQKEATREAGELAGLNVVATVTEPNAAAIAYGMLERAESEGRDVTVLIFDLGGGTLDATLMKVGASRVRMIGSDGDARLGGLDWDQEIVDFAKEHFRKASGDDFDEVSSPQDRVHLWKEAQRAKEELSRPEKDAHRFLMTADQSTVAVVITRAEFEQRCEHLVERCLERCDRLFGKTSQSWSRVDEILMVGNSTRMPMIQDAIRRISGRQLIIDDNPKLMVAKGAAILGHWVRVGKLDARWGDQEGETSGLEERDSPTVTGCTAHGLGVLVRKSGANHVSLLIPPNTVTPHVARKTYFTTTADATAIDVPLYEGESEDPSACVRIGRALIDGLPPRPKGSPVEVSFNIDISGRLEVEVTDVETGNKRAIVVDRNVLRSNGADLDFEQRRQRLSEIEIL